jgi:hypothetical protein
MCFVGVDSDGLLIWLGLDVRCAGRVQETKEGDTHVLLFDQHLNETFNCPALRNGDFEGLSAAYWTVGALLMLKCVGIYSFCTDEHKVVVEICR